MRRLFILIAFLSVTALFVTQTGRAQGEIQLGTLEIDLLPEYDQPNMLVIYKITLQPQPETVISNLTFHIPKAAGQNIVVASKLDNGQLYITNFNFVAGNEWDEVTFTPDSNEFQIEYYDPRLEISPLSRSFSYTWPGDYYVNSATIVIQQPWDANHMQFTPPIPNSKKGEDDLYYFAHIIGTLKKGQTYNFSLSYQKSTNTLTHDKQSVRPVSTLPLSMWNRGLPWALGVLALLLIAGGVWIYWRSGLPQAGEKKRKRRKPISPADETTEDSGVYCHSCGRRASAGDVFCRSCGTKLRI